MKQPKKLTRTQKEKLRKKGFDWNDYMLLTEDEDTFTVIAKHPETKESNKKQMIFRK